MHSVANWFKAGLSFLYPEICQVCHSERATETEGFVCETCHSKLRFIEPPYCDRCGLPHEGAITSAYECGQCQQSQPHFSKARSAVAARDAVLDVIHQYKYYRALWFEPFLAALLMRRAVPYLSSDPWDLIVPIPLHSTKEREREFNQAERLAARLSASCGVPMDKSLVRRVVATRTQTLLSREERLANMRKAFAIVKGRGLNGQRVVLVDDVFTTGATASSCAKTLKDAGASEVCVWTVARGT
jgi:competence protein ComFC